MLDPNSTTPLNVIMDGTAKIGVFEVYGGFISTIANSTPGGEIVNALVRSVGNFTSDGTIGTAQHNTGAVLNGQHESTSMAAATSGAGILTASLPGEQVIAPAPVSPNNSQPVTTTPNLFPFIQGYNGVIEVDPLPGRSFTFLNGFNLNHMMANPFTPALGPVITAPTTVMVPGPNGTMTSVIQNPVPVGPAEDGVALLKASDGVGNIDIIGMNAQPLYSPTLGNIGSLQASIIGPVFNTGYIGNIVLGSLGVQPSGSGETTAAGLYSEGQVGPITNAAPCDIRGSLISSVGFTSIKINNGSIINADIGELAFMDYSTEVATRHEPIGSITPITNPVLDVGDIVVTGNGGIVGAALWGRHFGRIVVSHGFGILETNIDSASDNGDPSLQNGGGGGIIAGSGFGSGDATVRQIIADGYGLRDVLFAGGSSIQSIIAAGHGQNISTQVFSPEVRLSEVTTAGGAGTYDPAGFQPNLLDDIDLMTGATAAVPQVAGAPGRGTDAGIIDGSVFLGNRDLGAVSAYQIRGTASNRTVFNFANSIGTVASQSNIDGLSLTTGRLKSFHPVGSVNNMALQIAGRIGSLQINGNVSGSSSITASGRNGNIGTIKILGNYSGTITANRLITSALVVGNFNGSIQAPVIGTFKINGIADGGNLTIMGLVTNFQTLGNLGLPGETITINGNVKSGKVGGNINANLVVHGNLSTLKVGQSILDGTTVTVDGVLGLLQVGGDVQAGSTVMASLVKKVKVKGAIDGVIT
jgi:hypothetical protein